MRLHWINVILAALRAFYEFLSYDFLQLFYKIKNRSLWSPLRALDFRDGGLLIATLNERRLCVVSSYEIFRSLDNLLLMRMLPPRDDTR